MNTPKPSPAPQITSHLGDTPWRVELGNGRQQWQADEPADLGGGDTAPTPFELLLSSLGACTAITLKMFAARKQWPLADVDVQLTLNPDGAPAAGSNRIQRRVTLHGPLDEAQRTRLLQVANACPVHKLLTGTIEVDTALADEAEKPA